MNRCKLSIFTLLFVVATSLVFAPMAFAWDPPKPGLDFMNVMVDKALLDNHKLSVGDQIGVFTPGGVLAGLGVVQNPDDVLGFAVYGDDPIVEGRQGFFANEALTFRIKPAAAQQDVAMDVTWSDGPVTYHNDTVLRVKLAAGIGAPNIVLSGLERDFGAVKVGAAATWVMKISNTGRADLKISGVSIDNAAFTHDFGVNAVVLGAGQTRNVTVTFTPVNAIDYSGKMTVSSDDADEGTLFVNLTGAGSAVLPPMITFNTSSRNFGKVPVNSRADWALKIGNAGDQDLTVTNVIIPQGMPYTSDFGANPKVVKNGELLNVTFTFAPVADGTFPTDVTIDIGKGADNPKIRLRGEGIVLLNPALSLSNVSVKNNAYSLFMGNVKAGMSYTHNLIVNNASNAPGDLTITGMEITGDNAAMYSVNIPPAGLRLRPGDSYKVPVTFAPKAVRFYPATLVIHSNNPAVRDADVSVALNGQGADPQGLEFGYFRYGTTATTHDVLVTEAKLDGELLIPGDEVGVFMPSGVCAGAGTIRREGQGVRASVSAWGASNNAVVDGFLADQPFTFKIYSAETGLEVVAKATFTNGPQVFAVNGNSELKLDATSPAPAPKMLLPATNIAFGQVLVVNSIAKKTLTISNAGQAALVIDSLVSDRAAFTTNFVPANNRVNAGSSMDVVISYDPTEERLRVCRLTIFSNDPVNPVSYVDLTGEGVAVVDMQKLVLSATAYNFNLKNLGTSNSYPLLLSNTGSATATVNSVTVNGDPAFTVDWSNRTEIGAGDSKVLNIKFAPVAEGNFSASVSIRWNDPKDPNFNGEQVFKVYGKGKSFATRWAVTPTALVQYVRAIAMVREGANAEAALAYKGSEIGAFTSDGFCAGVAVIGDDPNVKFELYGDNVATPEVDGFKPNEKLTFKIWDKQRWVELVPATVEVIGGTLRYTAGKTTQVVLHAVAPDVAPLAIDPATHFFGTVKVGMTSTVKTIKITNNGQAAITVTGVESSLPGVFKSNFDGKPAVLNPAAFIEVGITFSPAAKDVYIGTIAIVTDKGVAIMRPTGLGGLGEHWPIYTTESSHTILLTNVKYGAEKMAIGDEIAAVRPNGQIAGAGVAVEEGKVGIAAFGDDGMTTGVTEGFLDNEAIAFRFFDKSSGKEYSQDGVQGLPANPIQWTNNDFDAVVNEVVLPNIFSVVNPGPQFKDEGQAVAFDLKVSGAPNGAAISMAYMAEEVLPGGAPALNYDAANKIGHFSWQTNLSSSGTHKIGIHTYAVTGQDTVNEHITVIANIANVNQAPVIIRENLPIDLRDDDTLTMAKNQAAIVLNPFIWFSDPDGDNIMIDREADNADLIRHEIDYMNKKFTITPVRDQVGLTAITFRANDLVDGAPGFDRVSRKVRSLSMTDDNERVVGPRRDLITQYKFIVKLIDGKRPLVADDGIPMKVFNEDQDSIMVGDLDNFVTDPDGGALTFTAMDVPNQFLKVMIDKDTHELRVGSALKDFWSTDTLWFTIKAKSAKELTAFATVRVLINSVNDAPQEFALLTPEHRAFIDNNTETIRFTWEESKQNQWEIGKITYKLYCYMNLDLQNFMEVPLVEPKWDVLRTELVESLKGDSAEERTYTWWVKAFDEEGANVTSSDKFTFVIPKWGVDEEYSTIPTKLTFDGNYPNPFNGLTTVKFGVPTNTTVDVTVWDMSGRRIATLAQGRVSAGWHTATWNANALPTGLYFIRITAGSEQIMKKAVLIK